MPDILTIAIVVVAVLAILAMRALFERVTVYEFQRGLLYRNGRFVKLVGAGSHLVYRPSTSIRMVDARVSVETVPGQEVVTSDGVSVRISLAVQRKVADPVKAMHEVEDWRGALYSALQVALRETVAALTIDDLLLKRDSIGPDVLARSVDAAKAIGVELIAVAVKDLMFPGPMKKLFAQVVEARQQGLATLERARGETAALRSLANAARMVEANPSLIQLRMLQQLESNSGNTVILGMPEGAQALVVPAAGGPSRGEGAGRPDRARSDTPGVDEG